MPIQVWLPAFFNYHNDHSDSERDHRRATEAWRGEQTIFTVPGLDENMRWEEGGFSLLAIPGEKHERWDIYHVGGGGWVWGAGSLGVFPAGKVQESLLDLWLNARFDTVESLSSMRIEMPEFDGSQLVGYSDQEVPVKLNRMLTHLAHFPPIENPPNSVVQEEGLKVRGRRGLFEGGLSVEGPLKAIFPMVGPSEEDLLMHERSKVIAEQSVSDREAGLQEALNLAAPYIEDAVSIRFLTEYLPQLAHEESLPSSLPGYRVTGAVDWEGRQIGINEALRSPRFRAEARSTLRVKRLCGASALFLHLLICYLEEYRTFQMCQKCERILRGSKRKRYCSKWENPDCFRRRRAGDQRRRREAES